MADLSKRDVRRQRRALRREIAANRDRQVDATGLAREVLALLAEHGLTGGTTTLYESLPEEPPTELLLAALHEAGFRVLLPITLPDLDLDWFAADDPDRSALGKDAIATADLVLTPGLSVDRSGTRLGQGGGCYDKALPRRARGIRVHTLLHPGEVSETPLPRQPHDVVVDGIVTAEGRVSITR